MFAIQLSEIEVLLLGVFRRITPGAYPDFKSPQVLDGYKSLQEKGLVRLKFHEDGSLATVTLTQKGWSML